MGIYCDECHQLWSQSVTEPKQCTKCNYGMVKCCGKRSGCGSPGCFKGEKYCPTCKGAGQVVYCRYWKSHGPCGTRPPTRR
ncbi:uncharacterized protein P884DRAFT_207732 [Thermothelomyces heterothallicus CBS 202.75]|uniref:uncharacterized protein n=1 Tax=Thermothelomyces heterothallicus CBS 202.75 TaxID=1149848 RepID=UPI0037430301